MQTVAQVRARESASRLVEDVTRWSRSAEISRAFLDRLRAIATARQLPFVLAIHAVLMVASSYLALWLRFDGNVAAPYLAVYLQTLPWVLAIRIPVFLGFGLFGGLWRYASVWDLTRIVAATFASSAAIYLLVYRPLGAGAYPRSIVIIDSVLFIFFAGGARLLRRVMPRNLLQPKRRRRVLIVGAGDAGEMIVREMQKGSSYLPVGFIDDDRMKIGRSIHGVPVLGTRNDIRRLVSTTRAVEVLVAIPSVGPGLVRNLVAALEPFNLPLTTLPSLRELLNGKVGVSHIRPLAIEDLLLRKQVTLSSADAKRLIEGKRVIVTGAGGSIGSELCRQIAFFRPASLILYERYENSLYAIANDLIDRGLGDVAQPVIGDVTDRGRLDAVFAENRPEIVFHAAAHKHVPLMEANPCEAVKNNVAGTQVLAEAAQRHDVECFVLISTDKAANPSSVMGASKRVAELVVQAASARGRTRFVTVRFGNVLGSNGSVIPRMLDQIRGGGPVTVTHPDIRRYFMLIPEAVSLVLQAAVLARNRDTLVLDMGEQLRVVDLARNLIRLSGFVPDEEVPISFIGLRPGEKLSEELVGEGEELEPSGTEKILRVRRPSAAESVLRPEVIAPLVDAAARGRAADVVEHLRRIVPTFVPSAPGHRVVPVAPSRQVVSSRPLPVAVAIAASAPQA